MSVSAIAAWIAIARLQQIVVLSDQRRRHVARGRDRHRHAEHERRHQRPPQRLHRPDR